MNESMSQQMAIQTVEKEESERSRSFALSFLVQPSGHHRLMEKKCEYERCSAGSCLGHPLP
jgi:hypothetical protein